MVIFIRMIFGLFTDPRQKPFPCKKSSSPFLNDKPIGTWSSKTHPTKSLRIWLGYQRGICHKLLNDINWVIPLPSNSHHQDYEPFLVGNPKLNLHLPLLLGGGANPRYKVQNQRKGCQNQSRCCFSCICLPIVNWRRWRHFEDQYFFQAVEKHPPIAKLLSLPPKKYPARFLGVNSLPRVLPIHAKLRV